MVPKKIIFLKSVPHIQKTLDPPPHNHCQAPEHSVLRSRDNIPEQANFLCERRTKLNKTLTYGQKK